MTLLERLKPEYKGKLNDVCIKILLKYEYYVDLTILDASFLCVNLIDKNLELGLLQNLFYEIKEMKNE